MLYEVLNRVLRPVRMAVRRYSQLESEQALITKLKATVAHERGKVLGLKRDLERTSSRIGDLESSLDELARQPPISADERADALKVRLVDAMAHPEFLASDQRVTAVVTSCNRHDLLVRTLTSFFATNTFPIEKMIVVEDGDMELPDAEKAAFKDQPVEWINTGGRAGQIRAIDHAYAHVRTPYIFHIEDDYEFVVPGFIERSLTILRAEPLCLQVWIRGRPEPSEHPHPIDNRDQQIDGVGWRQVVKGYKRTWHGFSFNPGLRRLREYRLIGSSYGKIANPARGQAGYAEKELSQLYNSVGYFAAALWEDDGKCFARHIGQRRHVA